MVMMAHGGQGQPNQLPLPVARPGGAGQRRDKTRRSSRLVGGRLLNIGRRRRRWPVTLQEGMGESPAGIQAQIARGSSNVGIGPFLGQVKVRGPWSTR